MKRYEAVKKLFCFIIQKYVASVRALTIFTQKLQKNFNHLLVVEYQPLIRRNCLKIFVARPKSVISPS